MQRDSENYLEYQPNLQYTKDKTANVTAGSGVSPVASARPVIPAALEALKARTSGDVLQGVQDALDLVGNVLSDLEKKLANDVAGGLTFPEYIAARAQDPAKAKAYEAAHQESITGSPAMDVMPALLDVQAELGGIKDLIADRFYDGGLPRNLEEAKKKEKDHARDLGEMAVAGKEVPLDKVRMDNTLRDVISDRVTNATGFIQQAADGLKTNINHDTGGRPTVAVQALVSVGGLLTQVEELNKLNFDKQQEDFSNQQQRVNRLTPVAIRVGVPTRLSELQRQAVQYKAVIDHFASMNIGPDHPAAVILNNTVNGLQKVHDELRNLSVDAYRLNGLQGMQGATFLTAVNNKRLARQMHSLIGDVKRHYDPSGPNGLQVQRIADLQTKR